MSLEKIQAAKAAVFKKYGSEALVSPDSAKKINVIPSGSFLLDFAIGVGGIPRGRLTEIYGIQSSGKSTISLSAIRNCQKLGFPVLYLDFEHAFDPEYAKLMGVSLDEDLWILAQPDNLEQGLNILEVFIQQDLVGIVVVDSVAAMTPKAYLEGEIGGDKRIAEQARVTSQALARLTPQIHAHDVAVLFINHVRTLIGGRPGRKTTPGGDTLKFYSSVRIELTPIETVSGNTFNPITGKGEKGALARKVKAVVVKNKLAPPYREGFFYLRPEFGIHETQAIADVALERGLIKRSGSRYALPFKKSDSDDPVNLAGLQGAVEYLDSNPDKLDILRGQITELLGQKSDSKSVGESPAVKELDIGTEEELASEILE